MSGQLFIDERFCGPPGSANGGYTCGLLAASIDGPAEVTLRAPPPLDEPMIVERQGAGVTLRDSDGSLVAEARPSQVEVDPPRAITIDDAQRAASGYPWRGRHPYPTCFVCGPDRDPNDGLEIFPGPVDGEPMFAAPWTPEADLADDRGVVADEFVWAALDCPSGIVTDQFGDVGQILLGRLAADLMRPVIAEQPHIVEAWTVKRDARKLHTASALFSPEGELCACAKALWIEVSSPS